MSAGPAGRVPPPPHVAAPFPLVYVCRYCGVTVARYPHVSSHEPATLTVCAALACLAQAAEAYRDTLRGRPRTPRSPA